jgi:hypothetical protein
VTTRQRAWIDAAEHSEPLAAGLFLLIAQPRIPDEREHSCREHAVGFRRHGRRGFKCGVCRQVVKWVDPE